MGFRVYYYYLGKLRAALIKGLLWLLTLKAGFIPTPLPVSMATEMHEYRF